MKKGGFSFSAAGGPTPRDDSARSDRKENALPRRRGPASLPHTAVKAGGEERIQAQSRCTLLQRYSDSMHLPQLNIYLYCAAVIIIIFFNHSGILKRLSCSSGGVNVFVGWPQGDIMTHIEVAEQIPETSMLLFNVIEANVYPC